MDKWTATLNILIMSHSSDCLRFHLDIYPEYIESILSILWILLIETITFLQRSSFKKIGNQLVLSFFIISRKNYLFKML